MKPNPEIAMSHNIEFNWIDSAHWYFIVINTSFSELFWINTTDKDSRLHLCVIK